MPQTEPTETGQGRIHWIDAGKGLGIALIGILWGTVGSDNLAHSSVWFLSALFWTMLVVYQWNHRIACAAVRTAALLGLTARGCLMAERVELPMSLVPALLALPLFQAGYMYRNSSEKRRGRPPIGGLFCCGRHDICVQSRQWLFYAV